MSARAWIRFAFVTATLAALPACEEMSENMHPVCEVRPPTILMAESVRTASRIPCVTSLPIGWEWGAFRAEDGTSTFALGSASGGEDAVTVRLVARCTVDGAAVDERPDGVSVAEHVLSRDPYEAERTYAFDGGCALVHVGFVPGAPVDQLLRDVDGSIGFLDRGEIDAAVRSESDRRLDPADV